MLSWLWRWARPRKASVPSAGSAPGTPTRAAAEAPSDALFFEQLARDAAPVPEVPEHEEPLITALVLDVVAHLARKKVEPPVMPALVPRVLAIVNQPEVDLAKLTHVIEQDLAISAKLLSVANSSVFGASVEIRSVRQAVAYLGTEQVAQVAIGLACSSSFEASSATPSTFAPRWAALFRHAMTCAFSAAHLAKKSGRGAEDDAFLAGLFHDVGKAVALRALEQLAKTGRLADVSDNVIDEALHRIHAYPGEEFYDKWTLPASLMELCTQHHQLEDMDADNPTFYFVTLSSSFDVLHTGCAAEQRDALVAARTSADRLALSEDELRAAYTQTRAFAERAARML